MKPRFHILFWLLIVLLIISVLLPAVVLMFSGQKNALLYCIPAFVFTLALMGISALAHRKQIRYVAKLGDSCEHAELAVIEKLMLGVCVLDRNGVLLQQNPYFFAEILGGEDLFGHRLTELIPLDPTQKEQDLVWQERSYHVSSLQYEKDGNRLTALLWTDTTELIDARRNLENTRPCVMLLVLDNYEDLIQNAKESAKLEISIAIEKLLENFISETNGVLHQLKTDRFLMIIEEQHVQQMIAGKFKILDDARQILVDEKNCVTFSIGVGHGAMTLQESEQFARQSLDMALGRGGDQAAVRTENGFRFFGGVSKGVEKKSRARTRMVAGAIQEAITSSRNVMLMGHRFGDLDSVGSACAMAGAIRLMGIPVSVVVDPVKNLSQQLISLVSEEIGEDMFITPERAAEELTDDTLLIIVDTHNKDILESEQLYRAAKKVVVIDHHRKNVNYVDNALVFHHEPYASSACEMVTELIQYFKNCGTLDSCYADCLLSGIMLDTKNFVMRTGVRTFEAAAYLRRIGADTVKVKCLFSGSIEAYRSRTEIVGSAEIIGRNAVAVVPPGTPEVRLVAPQAADELLTISDVDAAFVIYDTNHVISISARSLGAVNVQVIMEQLGGGGHQTMAATQIPSVTAEEAKLRLLQVIGDLQNN